MSTHMSKHKYMSKHNINYFSWLMQIHAVFPLLM